MKFETWVKKMVAYLKPIFFVDEYAFTVLWADHFPEDDDGVRTMATIKVNTTYLIATVRVGKSLKDMYADDPEQAGLVLVHEMSHLLTQPLWDLLDGKISDEERYYFEPTLERQTQRIANTVAKLLPAKWWLVK